MTTRDIIERTSKIEEPDYNDLSILEMEKLLEDIVRNIEIYKNIGIKAASPVSINSLMCVLYNNAITIRELANIIMKNAEIAYEKKDKESIERLDKQRILLNLFYLTNKLILEPMCNDESNSKSIEYKKGANIISYLISRCDIDTTKSISNETDKIEITFQSVQNSIEHVQDRILSLTPSNREQK